MNLCNEKVASAITQNSPGPYNRFSPLDFFFQRIYVTYVSELNRAFFVNPQCNQQLYNNHVQYLIYHKLITLHYLNWENISKSWAQFRQKRFKNVSFEKVHRIRKTSRTHFSLFRKHYDAKEVISYLQRISGIICLVCFI